MDKFSVPPTERPKYRVFSYSLKHTRINFGTKGTQIYNEKIKGIDSTETRKEKSPKICFFLNILKLKMVSSLAKKEFIRANRANSFSLKARGHKNRNPERANFLLF